MEDEEGKRYQPIYLRSISAQLSALFNHTVRYYGLKDNPVKIAGSMGSSKVKEMLFWTREEYQMFKGAMKEKPVSYYAFEILYWCGIRCGKLLALTKGDFDLEKKILTINKSLQHLKDEIYVTDPKTQKSNRVIDLPDFLCDEMEDFFPCFINVTMTQDFSMFQNLIFITRWIVVPGRQGDRCEADTYS